MGEKFTSLVEQQQKTNAPSSNNPLQQFFRETQEVSNIPTHDPFNMYSYNPNFSFTNVPFPENFRIPHFVMEFLKELPAPHHYTGNPISVDFAIKILR